jgi:hypothetical protein
MRHRRSRRFLITLAGLLATPGAAFAVVPMQGASVSLPGVPGTRALEVCTEAAGKLMCRKVTTPKIRSGRVSVRWNRGLRATVVATPVSAFPAQCHGRPGARIDASVVRAATDLTLSVEASYAGASSPRTVVSVNRSVGVDRSAAIWACLR